MKRTVFIFSFLILGACTTPQVKETTEEQAATETRATEEMSFFDSASDSSTSTATAARSSDATFTEQYSDVDDIAVGYASWYGRELQGKPTASGELFNMYDYTAAHRKYPMGSIVLVKNLENNKKQLVRINDRGPYVDGRVTDVSFAVARDLGFAEKGVAKVQVELIESGKNDFMQKAAVSTEEPQQRTADVAVETTEASEEEEDLLAEANIQTASDGYSYADGLSPQGYTIQVGAFKKRSNAERYRREMEASYGHRVFIATKNDWHFVWVGDFEDVDEAKTFFRKLRDDGVEVMYRGKVS